MPVWKSHEPLGQTNAIHGMAGVAAPLLTGFSLTAIIMLQTVSDPPRLHLWAVTLFALSATTLLIAVDMGLRVLQYSASPATRLEWRPESRINREALEEERKLLAVDHANWDAYDLRTRRLYDSGVTFFLFGVLLVVWPDHGRLWPLNEIDVSFESVAGWVVTVALLLHLSAVFFERPASLFPYSGLSDVLPLEPLTEEEWSAVRLSKSDAAPILGASVVDPWVRCTAACLCFGLAIAVLLSRRRQ